MRLQDVPLITLLGSVAAASSLQKPASVSHAPASRLWATHYNGNVYSLTLSGANLSITDTQKTCGAMPSWLTFDAQSRTLYCSDENGTVDASTHGSLTAYHAAADGKLKQIAKTNTVGGGVYSTIFEAGKSDKYLAIAHYEGAAVSTYSLPLTDNAPSKQAFHFNLTHPGATPQQDTPHPHSIFLDPTGSFLISPDLGADLLHIYSIGSSDGTLHDCPSVNVTFGSGPRHGVFWSDGTTKPTGSAAITHARQAAAVGETQLYLVNEIGGTLDVFDVSYARDGCLDLSERETVVPYAKDNSTLPSGATPSEIRLVGEKLYVSIRSDKGFSGNDSVVTLDRAAKDGSVSVSRRSQAWGKVPRTMVVNKAGDLVAVGNQASATVAIVRRNRENGELGERVAILQVGEPGTVGQAEGLSSVIWEE